MKVGSWELYTSWFPLAQAKWRWVPTVSKRRRRVVTRDLKLQRQTIIEVEWLCLWFMAFGPRG